MPFFRFIFLVTECPLAAAITHTLCVHISDFGVTSLSLLVLHHSSSAGREAEAARSRWMSLQNLQAYGPLLGTKPQRASLLH